MHRLLVLFAFVSYASFSTATELPTAAQMEKLILGAWSEELEVDGAIASGISRYASDHTVEHIGSVSAGDYKADFHIRSKWSIEGDTLITEVLETNQPEMVEVGDIERDTILSMTSKQWTYRDSYGYETTAVRLQE